MYHYFHTLSHNRKIALWNVVLTMAVESWYHISKLHVTFCLSHLPRSLRVCVCRCRCVCVCVCCRVCCSEPTQAVVPLSLYIDRFLSPASLLLLLQWWTSLQESSAVRSSCSSLFAVFPFDTPYTMPCCCTDIHCTRTPLHGLQQTDGRVLEWSHSLSLMSKEDDDDKSLFSQLPVLAAILVLGQVEYIIALGAFSWQVLPSGFRLPIRLIVHTHTCTQTHTTRVSQV